ncbi:hypothetical protein ABIA32_006632, partial [Streptacidiphilus sp. MAP12-20]|uniref:hypothetical protein n=1 Tax=Streptacidiphilus sp. MAP12-20 TaxID=3156299 RepID=UPI003518FA9C
MHIHRSQHTSGFTALPNELLQNRRVSYTAKGLLSDLLSRPDGWREDGKNMADNSPQGRGAIRRALRELTDAGYYRVVKVRQEDGRILSEAHVYDVPQPAVAPGVDFPDSGEPGVDRPGAKPPKKREKEPTLPAQRRPGETGGSTLTVPQSDPATREAVAALYRVTRGEPRLRLGAAEALELAPLVATWLERVDERDLAQALLPGLPRFVMSARGLLKDRLIRKSPLRDRFRCSGRPDGLEVDLVAELVQ